jgi:hypothetical protein
MSSEIDKAIELIEEKIAALEKVRDTLVEMFDPPDSLRSRLLVMRRAASIPAEVHTPESTPSEMPATNLLSSGNGIGRSTRKDEVAKFIRDRGGCAKRSDIIAGTGIPKGTVAYVLNDKSRFAARRGLWRNVEVKKGPLSEDGESNPDVRQVAG